MRTGVHGERTFSKLKLKSNRKLETGLKGADNAPVNRYLLTDKAYHTEGFTTHIRQATKKEYENRCKIGLELLSRYLLIDVKLLQLHLINTTNSYSTTTMEYQVTSGIIKYGKLYITTQVLSEEYITIDYHFRERVKPGQLANVYNMAVYDKPLLQESHRAIKDLRFNLKGYGTIHSSKIHYRDNIRRKINNKYKE